MTDMTPSDGGFDPTDPIAKAWAEQGDAGPSSLPSEPDAVANSVAKAHRKDQRRLLWLNVQEIVPCVAVAGYFGASALDSQRPLASLASAVPLLAIAIYLAVSSIRHHRADRGWGTSIRDQLARRLAQVEHRSRLYRNVAWWYLLPFVLAMALFFYGSGGGKADLDVVSAGIWIALLTGIYWVNRWFGRTRYDSEVERLESLLAEFDHEAEPDSATPDPKTTSPDSTDQKPQEPK